jgi:hypothetical protein
MREPPTCAKIIQGNEVNVKATEYKASSSMENLAPTIIWSPCCAANITKPLSKSGQPKSHMVFA